MNKPDIPFSQQGQPLKNPLGQFPLRRCIQLRQQRFKPAPERSKTIAVGVFGLGLGGCRKPGQLPGVEHDGLGEVQGGVGHFHGNAGQQVAQCQLLIGQPAIFPAEHQGSSRDGSALTGQRLP